MRLTHPDPDVDDMFMPNTTTAAEWAKANGWTIADDDVELLDPADHPEPPAAGADEPDASAG